MKAGRVRLALALLLLAGGLFLFWQGRRLFPIPSPQPCLGEHERISVNGVEILYEKAGEGPPILLLHGNGGSHEDLQVLTRQLAFAGYQVYALDSRGQGANAPLAEYHYADMAADVRAFIHALGLEKPVLYGFSDGGIVGLLTEIQEPGTLGALAISGANCDPEGLTASSLLSLKSLQAVSPSPLLNMVLTEPNITREQLQGLSLPVLITAGSLDMIREEHTRKMAGAIPGAQMIILQGESHSSYILGSEKMGELLLSFLEPLGLLPSPAPLPSPSPLPSPTRMGGCPRPSLFSFSGGFL